MKKAYFAKYKKVDLRHATSTIKKLKESNATQIEYKIAGECFCSEKDIQKIFEQGTIIGIKNVESLGILSNTDDYGIWRCIKLLTVGQEVLIYTGGSSGVLYYSVL